MTAERLRDLLEERVADLSPIDASATAWARAQRVRRRRQAGVVAGGAAVVLAVAGGVAVLDDRRASSAPSIDRPTATPTDTGPTYSATAEATPDPVHAAQAEYAGKFRGAPFWWAPSAGLDPELPELRVPGIPAELSMADEEPMTIPPSRVDAVFATGDEQYRLLSDASTVSVDLSDRLGPVADNQGNEFNPLQRESVSPDGTQVFFVQHGRLEVWDLPTNTWDTVPMSTADAELAEWTRDGTIWVPGSGDSGRPDPWDRGDFQYSQVVVGPGGAAEFDWTVDGLVPGLDSGVPGRYANPEILVAGSVDDPDVLGIGIVGRSKVCCSPVGWFGHDLVLFEAWSEGGTRVLAWRVGTPDLYRVSQFVDVPRRFAFGSWAEDAFSSAGQ